MKDHGRAQETVVIGYASARHRPSFSSSWVGRGAGAAMRRDWLRCGGADSCQAFAGARLLTYRYDPSVMKAEAQHCARWRCFACTVEAS